jgi:replicative DNA helicase
LNVSRDRSRELPSDVAAERATLGAILLSPSVADDLLDQLKPEQFYLPFHARLIEVMRDLRANRQPVDPVAVHAEAMRRGIRSVGEVKVGVLIANLVEAVPLPANGRYYAALVLEQAVRRRAIEAATRLAQVAYSGEGDLDRITEVAVHELAGVRATFDRHARLLEPRERPSLHAVRDDALDVLP